MYALGWLQSSTSTSAHPERKFKALHLRKANPRPSATFMQTASWQTLSHVQHCARPIAVVQQKIGMLVADHGPVHLPQA